MSQEQPPFGLPGPVLAGIQRRPDPGLTAYRLSDRDAANSIIKKAKRAFLEATGHERDEAQLRFRRLLRSRAEVLRARLEDDEHRHAARRAEKPQMQRSSTRDNGSVTRLSQVRHEARAHRKARVASAANERDSAVEETQLSPGLCDDDDAIDDDEETQLKKIVIAWCNCEGGDTITAFAMLRLPVESRMREFLPCTLCATHRSVCRTCSLIWPVADRSRAL